MIFRYLADAARFVGEEGSVGSEDAVLGGERDELVHKLFIAAFEVELVDDVANAAGSPELGDEGVGIIITFVDQVGGEVERLFLVADGAAEGDFGFAVGMVAADDDGLVASEQIEGTWRIHAVDDRRGILLRAIDVNGNRDVGHDGSTDAVVEFADRGFDVFVGSDVFALAEVGAGELVEEVTVDVEADAKGEEARTWLACFELFSMAVSLVWPSVGRPSVRKMT